jgi:hypothetical protein
MTAITISSSISVNPECRLRDTPHLGRSAEVFELRRVDSGGRDILADLDQILKEIPATGRANATDLARIIIEDRE